MVSLVLQLAGKLVMLMLLARNGQYWVLLLIPAWARWGALVWARLPSLKPGLGAHFGLQTRQREIWAWCATLLALSLSAPALCAVPVLIAMWRYFLLNRLGGMTGDLLGAGVELMESCALLLCLLVPVGSVMNCVFC